ncbi:MAG: ribosomal protein [Rickettsiales bacterium]|jgi:small subunit ribosomal protein S7|nr:ribosomal protein [Rickettsiales bacterium]
MSRRHAAQPREVFPDPKYGNVLLSKFMNMLMLDGKKSVAESIVYDALDLVTKFEKRDALEVFVEAIENVEPPVEVRSRRVGGATYQVPVEVREKRKKTLAIRWLINTARGRSEKEMAQRLAKEIIDASHKRGSTFKKREDTIKMAEANKAFSHYRW